MKGSGGGYGFDEITDIGMRIEDAANGSDRDEILRQNERLCQYLQNVKVVYQDEE